MLTSQNIGVSLCAGSVAIIVNKNFSKVPSVCGIKKFNPRNGQSALSKKNNACRYPQS